MTLTLCSMFTMDGNLGSVATILFNVSVSAQIYTQTICIEAIQEQEALMDTMYALGLAGYNELRSCSESSRMPCMVGSVGSRKLLVDTGELGG